MDWLRKLASHRLLDVGAAVIALVSVIRIAGMLPRAAVTNDFAHYYLSSRLLLEGLNPYSTPLAPRYAREGFFFEADVPTATNPPLLLWLLAPLARLSARPAFWVWAAVEVVSLMAVLWLTQQLLGDRLTRRAWFFVVAAVVASATVFWHFYFSQAQLLLTALVLAAYRWRQMGKLTVACVVVTLAGLLKLFPFVLLPWFVWGDDGRWRGAMKRLAVCAVLSVAVIAATGVDLWWNFGQFGLKVVTACAMDRAVFSLPAFVANLGLAAYDFAPPSGGLWWLGLTAVAVGVLVIGGTYLCCGRLKLDRETQFCLLCIAMLTGGPTSRGHYFVFLIFPVVVVAARVRQAASLATVMLFVVVLILLNNLDTWQGGLLDRHLIIKVLANATPLLGLAGLVGLLWRCRSAQTPVSWQTA